MPKRKANDVEETEEEEEEEKTRVRRSPVRRRRRVNYNEQSDDDDDDDDDTSNSESSGDEEEDDNSSAERSEDEQDSDGSEEDGSNREQEPDEESDDDDDDDLTGPPFQCQHCQHTFTGINGLKYHVNNKVCQKAKKERRKTSKARGKSSGKHIRGTMNERTCPQCQKRFTSALGCQYHVAKAVCRKKDAPVPIPFATLKPGTKFVTPFGVVEVVADDRAVPDLSQNDNDSDADEDAKPAAVTKTNNSKKKLSVEVKRYRTAITIHNHELTKVRTAIGVSGVARRKEYARAYANGKTDRDAVWEIQYGKDPREIPSNEHRRHPVVQPVEMEDPNAPAWCFPGRIVECRWIPDARTRFVGAEDEQPSLDPPASLPDNRPNVFLQRRMLTEPYRDGLASYQCDTCGQKFSSRPGVVYHLQANKCNATEAKKTRAQLHVQMLEERANHLVNYKDNCRAKGVALLPPPLADTRALPKPTPRSFAARANEEGDSETDETPPAAATTTATKTRVARAKPTQGKHPKVGLAKTKKQLKNELKPDPNFVDPRIILADLEAQIRHQQSILIGPMYPVVYKALKFAKPGVKKKKKPRKTAAQKAKENAERRKLAQEQARQREEAERARKEMERQKREEEEKARIEMERRKREEEEKARKELERRQEEERAKQELARRKEERERARREMILRRKKEDEEKAALLDRAFSSFAAASTLLPMGKPISESEERKGFLKSLPNRPPLIDTRVIVQEIDAGRYPSINRQAALKPAKGVHADKCFICKSIGNRPLNKCNFCPQKVHIACARSKWTLPEPEPYDDFICTQCIQSVVHRRNRAERRKIERIKGVEAAATSLSVTEMVHPPIPLHREVVEGQEYEAVVSQGEHMANLLDLEADARKRLEMELDSMRLSSIRRQMMK